MAPPQQSSQMQGAETAPLPPPPFLPPPPPFLAPVDLELFFPEASPPRGLGGGAMAGEPPGRKIPRRLTPTTPVEEFPAPPPEVAYLSTPLCEEEAPPPAFSAAALTSASGQTSDFKVTNSKAETAKLLFWRWR